MPLDLPIPGADAGTWGTKLNNALSGTGPGTLGASYARIEDARRTQLYNPAALNLWRVALAKRGIAPAKIAILGDSNTEGTGATNYGTRMLAVLERQMRARLAMPGGSTFSSLSPKPAINTAAVTGSGVTLSGDVVEPGAYGLGMRVAGIKAGGSITLSFTGDRLRFSYVKAFNGGYLRIEIDGVAQPLVNQSSASTIKSTVWDSGPLTPGAHTVVFTRDVSSAAGTDRVYLNHFDLYNGDWVSGVRVYDHAKYGHSAATFAGSTDYANDFASWGPFGLLVIKLGTNDLASSTAATYKTNLQTIINTHRTTGAHTGSILLMHDPLRGGGDAVRWADYLRVKKEIADADTKVAVLDVSTAIPGYSNGGSALGIHPGTDDVHFNDGGQGWFADLLASVLTAN